MVKRTTLLAFAAVTLLALPADMVLTVKAQAEEVQKPQLDIELGEVPNFATEEAAIAACKPDGVVWADRKNGFYYPRFFKDYGKTKNGTYTCYKQAKAADYWSLTPSSDGGHRGREFPLQFCTICT